MSLCGGPPTSLASDGCQPGGWRVTWGEGRAAATVCASRSCRQGWDPSGQDAPSQERALILTTYQMVLLCRALEKRTPRLARWARTYPYLPAHECSVSELKSPERSWKLTPPWLEMWKPGPTEEMQGA